MRFHDIDPPPRSPPKFRAEFRSLAEKALIELVGRVDPAQQVDTADPAVERLCDALTCPDGDAVGDPLSILASSGLCTSDIVEQYYPAIARRLGEKWCADECSFVDVTLGVSRLQSSLRGLNLRRGRIPSRRRSGQDVLLVVPMGEQHSFGAAVAACQLHRAGYRTDVATDLDARALRDRLAQTRYSLVGFSLGSYRSLDAIEAMLRAVEESRKDGNAPGIAVGGWAIEAYPDIVDAIGPRIVGTTLGATIDYMARGNGLRREEALALPA